MARKIIQIAIAYAPGGDHTDVPPQDRLFALCDDGSVWIHLWPTSNSDQVEEWERLVDIPQDGPETTG